MEKLWWLEILGYVMTAMGAWRLVWRIPVILGLKGANKFKSAQGEQAEVNEATVAETKKGIPPAIVLLILGIILIVIF